MKRLLIVLVALFPPLCFSTSQQASNALTAEEVTQGWILLWDGQSTFGWEPQINMEWPSTEGALHSASGGYVWLRHKTPFANFVLKADFFMNSPDADSGIFIRAAGDGDPSKTGYQVNINNMNKDWGTGSLVFRHKSKVPVAKVKEWHTFEITAEGDHIAVLLDGKKTVDVHDSASATGYVGLQFIKGDEVRFRNIKLRPLGLQPLFNGTDLSGWERVDRPNVKMPPEWSVKDGAIHVEKGPGQLETSATFADFILQLEARTNAQNEDQHPNSGVFFRGDKGKFWSGYESQVRNEFKSGDRSQPVDFGTGGLYRFQPARRVVSSDNEFFGKTIIAFGRHIAIWVNGIQVVDYEDKREEGMEAAKQARIAAGPISLQAHDPTTNLDFRNLRIAAFPAK